MIILGVLLLVLVVGAWADYEFAFLAAIVSGMFLVIALLLLPVRRMGHHEAILKFTATYETVERARASEETWELAAFQQEIASANRWLAGIQYYNSTVFDIWIPDAVDFLAPIE